MATRRRLMRHIMAAPGIGGTLLRRRAGADPDAPVEPGPEEAAHAGPRASTCPAASTCPGADAGPNAGTGGGAKAGGKGGGGRDAGPGADAVSGGSVPGAGSAADAAARADADPGAAVAAGAGAGEGAEAGASPEGDTVGAGPDGDARADAGRRGGPWAADERVVVALAGGPRGDTLIRRAARIAARAGPGELIAVHVARADDRLSDGAPDALARQRALIERLGGSYHHVTGDDVPKALLEFARGVNATQLVLGASGRRGLRRLVGAGTVAAVLREAGDLDVHLVPHDGTGTGRGPAMPGRTAALGRRRRAAGWLLAVLAPPLLAVLLSAGGGRAGLPVGLPSFLALTVGVALVGGLWPAVVAAVAGFLLVNWFFTPPLHTFSVAEPANAFALAVFVAVAVAVATVVDLAARRSTQAARARAEATTLSMLATSVLRGEDALPALLERLRETFALSSVALLERTGDAWTRVASAGPAPAARPADADVRVRVTDALTLALDGRELPDADRRVVAAFAYQAAAALDRRRLAEQAREARRLAEGNRIRTALLAAVSHDLRTPLASIKAAVSSLRSPDVRWDPADEAELLAAIEESADRLDGLVANLLDMSRLQTGAVNPLARPVTLDEVIQPALAGVAGDQVVVEVPEDLPPVLADPGLLERSLANVVENAVRHGGGRPVRIGAVARDGRIELTVADRGPGVPDQAKDRIFEPFQRLGDRPRGSGVGLGLAVARGFAEAVGGRLRAEDTPGGGLTMVFSLPAAENADAAHGTPPEEEPT